MPKLVIDAGNTRIKAGIFAEDQLLESIVFGLNQWQEFLPVLIHKYEISAILLSDVGGLLTEILRQENFACPLYQLNRDTDLPFVNQYQSKQTLGADRKALVAGAMHFFPGSNCLVVDAGTCVTYDLLLSSQEYLGGNISPGLQMRLKAMHTFTGKLPDINWEFPEHYLGSSTNSCMLSGAYYGLCSEIEGFYSLYAQDYSPIQLILSGGDAQLLAKRIKTSIFVHEHLLLYGLNKILTHHAK